MNSMNSMVCNNMAIIEGTEFRNYILDNKNIWRVGRISKENFPEIILHTPTVSRKHGRLKYESGIWFYIDDNDKNGTICNGKKISKGFGERKNPVMLENGDCLIFGGVKSDVLNNRAALAVFLTKMFDKGWRKVDTSKLSIVQFIIGDNNIVLDNSQIGKVLNYDNGVAIYMGDVSYIMGDVKVHK